jgi:hypothetical protein
MYILFLNTLKASASCSELVSSLTFGTFLANLELSLHSEYTHTHTHTHTYTHRAQTGTEISDRLTNACQIRKEIGDCPASRSDPVVHVELLLDGFWAVVDVGVRNCWVVSRSTTSLST